MLRQFFCLCLLGLWYQICAADTLTFLGLRDDQWQIYSIESSDKKPAPKVVLERLNPRNFTRNNKKTLIAFVDESGALQLYDERTKKQRSLQPPEGKDRFTQLHFADDGRLWAVMLPDGNSRQTYLVNIDVGNGDIFNFVAKRGSQFDPFWGDGKLYYTSAHCVDDCSPMIWELWRRDENTGRQQQLTLGGAVSREPVLLGGMLYFISNRAGNYHIWKMPPDVGAEATSVTIGDVRDAFLAPGSDGGLFFIRKDARHTKIMHMNAAGEITDVPLPGWLSDIRNLEVQP